MKDIIVSSPGKVIIHGEHAVVYGKRALAASLNLRARLQIVETSDDCITVQLPDIGIEKSWQIHEITNKLNLPLSNPLNPTPPTQSIIDAMREIAGATDQADTQSLALVAFLYIYCSVLFENGTLPSARIKVTSGLPTSAGLGSSAAFSTCLAASCLLKKNLIETPETQNKENIGAWTNNGDLELINKWAFQAEKIIHGNPSGIDNSICTFGGALHFQAGKVTPLERVPQIKILLMNTKVPRSTKLLVAGVREKYDQYPKIIGPVLESIEAITDKCEETLQAMETEIENKHYETLKDLVQINQSHLEVLGVSHPSLTKICALTAEYGLASKLTGAGGGGCAFAIVTPDTKEEDLKSLMAILEKNGYQSFVTSMGGPGVTYHLPSTSQSDGDKK